MNRFIRTYAIIAFAGISLLAGCGVRNGSKGQKSVAGHAFDNPLDDQLKMVVKEGLTSPVILSEKVHMTPPELGDQKGTYFDRTFSHQDTEYRFAYFGKTGSLDLDEAGDMEPLPPVPGLIHGTFDVHCARDTCFHNRVVLAMRCPEKETLTAWMSKRVKSFLEESPVTDKDDDTPATPIPVCPRLESTAEICSCYLHALEGFFGDLRCPEPDPDRDGGYRQPAEQAGLMLFDCWRAGDLYTFYEATWYDWMSCGDNTTESYRTVDARTGKELSLKDFVDEKDYGRFAQILMKHLIKAAGNRADALEYYTPDGSDILPLLDGCGLIKEGLVVFFHPYTLGAGVYGQFNAVIPYHELEDVCHLRI